MSQVVGRFAPTPSGRMHVGNVFAALMAWLGARSQGGRLVLRIEDLDPRGKNPDAAQILIDDLRWLGLDWDEGPFYQSTQLMALGTINAGKYEEFAEGFFRRDRRAFSGEAFRHLYERFGGITWYIQCILNRVWTHGGGLDSTQQVDDMVDELVAESESFYFDLLRSQTSAEQSILKAIGREGVAKTISGGDFIRRNALPAASTVRSAAAKLTERDLLYRTDAGHVVYDRFFGIWLGRL